MNLDTTPSAPSPRRSERRKGLVVPALVAGLAGALMIAPAATATPPADPTPTSTSDPAPEAQWDVPNGTVNAKGATVLNDGHVDVASLVEDGRLTTSIKDTIWSSTPTWRDPAKTVLQLLPTSKATVPAGSEWSFLGTKGASVYQVSQRQQEGLLWPGWSTEHIDSGAISGEVTWHLTGMTGPGEFALYESDAFGQPDVLLNTRDGITNDDGFAIPQRTHAHGSWVFTEPGSYCLAFERSATPASGAESSDGFSLAFAVGDTDVMNVDPAACAGDPGPEPTVTPSSEPSAEPSVTPTVRPTVKPSPQPSITPSIKPTVKPSTKPTTKPTTGPTTKPTDKPTPKPDPVWDVVNGTVNAKGATVLNDGHVDVAALLDGNKLTTKIKDTIKSSTPIWRDPAKTVLQLLPSSQATVPAGSEWSFLGKKGATFYQVTQRQQPGLLWPGWSTEAIPVEATKGGVNWTLTGVSGPGHFILYETGAFGEPRVMFNTGDGITGSDAFTIPQLTHAHGSWAFTKQGNYCLSFTRSTTLASGKKASDAFSLAVAVGKADVMQVDPGACAADPGTGPTTKPTVTPSTKPTTGPTTKPTTKPTKPSGPGTDKPIPDAVWDVANGTVNNKGAAVMNNGHIDVASLLKDGKLVTKVKDTTQSSTPTWRDPAKTIVQLRPGSRITVPSGSQWSFLGKAGASFYQVSQTQQDGLIWPGWSTEAIPLSATKGGVAWALTDVSGPGEFAIFETGDFGQPEVLFNTRDGISGKDQITIPKNTHAHGSWAFSKQGNYCLSMQRTAQLASGKTVSDQFVLAVAVGTADVMNVDPAACGKKVDTKPVDVDPPPADDGPRDDGKKKAAPSQVAAGKKCQGITILSTGHIDYASKIDGGKLHSLIGDDTSGSKVYREPSATVMWLKPASKVTLPSGYGDVGAAGTQVWQVPQTQNPNLIWLGWNTELLNAGNASGKVSWKIDSISGPGTVKVYLAGAFGGVQDMVFNNGGSYDIPLGVHAHANWAFSKEGIYRIRTTQTAKLAGGGTSSDTETMTIAVGDVDPATACGTAGDKKLDAENKALAQMAAEQAAAQPAITGRDMTPVQNATGGPEGGVAETVEASTDGNAVPALLSVLGGLLMTSAGATGSVWLRNRTGGLPL